MAHGGGRQTLTLDVKADNKRLYLPNKAWNNRDLKIRMTRSMAMRSVRSCGADNRE